MHNVPIEYSDEVQNALSNGLPILGLESNVLSHGLPYPRNLEMFNACDEIIRSNGVIPALTFIRDKRICIGASPKDVELLTDDPKPIKVSARDIALCITQGKVGATTASASIAICELAGIRIFSTAGLGGVHRDFSETLDVSADLHEISSRKTIVVSAGVKKFLDIPKTSEVLESLGVPVVGFGTSEFPAFYCRKSGAFLESFSQDPIEIATAAATHIETVGPGGFLILVAPSKEIALDDELVEKAVQRSLINASSQGVRGKAITKFVMRAIDSETDNRSQTANFDVMVEVVNAAAQIARSLKPEFFLDSVAKK